jgi:hypothetical protein
MPFSISKLFEKIPIRTQSPLGRVSFTDVDYWFRILATSRDVVHPIVLSVNRIDTVANSRSAGDEIQTTDLSQFGGVFHAGGYG